VSVAASRDAALAARFTESPPAAAPPQTAKPAEPVAEKIAARSKGIEYEIPVYKYETLFKAQEDLLEPRMPN
jgi:hypothetical protein